MPSKEDELDPRKQLTFAYRGTHVQSRLLFRPQKKMRQKKTSLKKHAEYGWQILGEIELSIGVASGDTINKWLTFILDLLELHADFVNRILQSAQDSVLRAQHAESVVSSEHIHMTIIVPEDYELNNQNWGFFRIEKIGNEQASSDHTIELYLYQEG